LVVVISVVGSSLALSSSSAFAAGALVVTPSTGLADASVVTASGAGWNPAATIGFCQAVPHDPVSIDDCDSGITGITVITAGSGGTWSSAFQVSRFITVAGQTVDCAAPSSPCVLAAADASDIAGTAVWQTLAFAPVPPRVVPGHGQVDEGDSGTTNLDIPVTLSFASTDTVTVQWATQPDSCAGTPAADPANDYTAASGTLTFAPGDTSENISISVNGDTLVEPDECVSVALSNPTNATLQGSTATGTIVSDDTLTPDLVIKRRSDGTLLFDNSYTAFPSPYFHSITAGGYWTYAVLVQNDGDSTGDIVVQASAPAAPFDVQYFYGYYDVTAAVEGSGLLLSAMPPGETRPLAVRFHADSGTMAAMSSEITLSAVPSPALPDVGDVLRLRVQT
jgi:hypothetical protein